LQLNVNGNTTVIDDNGLRNITTIDGIVYTERRLVLSMQFEGGFIMTIEQKAEYPGQFKTKANGTSGRWKGKKKKH
jgi:hypothetical protein